MTASNDSRDVEGNSKLFVNVSVASTTGSNVSGADGGGSDGGLAIDFGSRFAPYTAVSAVSLLFNGLSLAALCFVRGPRTVHHRLLANLTVGDVVGTVLLWLYYNSPCIFPRFEVDGGVIHLRDSTLLDSTRCDVKSHRVVAL